MLARNTEIAEVFRDQIVQQLLMEINEFGRQVVHGVWTVLSEKISPDTLTHTCAAQNEQQQ
jgi:hypothetical protein